MNLTAEEAFWHASAGIPIEQSARDRIDADLASDVIPESTMQRDGYNIFRPDGYRFFFLDGVVVWIGISTVANLRHGSKSEFVGFLEQAYRTEKRRRVEQALAEAPDAEAALERLLARTGTLL